MKKANIYFAVLVFLFILITEKAPILAAEDTSSIMCDNGVVNIGDKDIDV